MAIKNTVQTYGSLAKFFHWTIALFVIVLLIVGFTMTHFITDKLLKSSIYNSHKLFGLTVLFLAALRLLWRFVNTVPVLPPRMPRWEKGIEKFVKFALYAVLFLMPLSGWVFASAAGYSPHIGNLHLTMPFIPEDKSIAKYFQQVHHFFAWALLGLLTLHIAGALKHHFIDKDNIFRRMLPGKPKNLF